MEKFYVTRTRLDGENNDPDEFVGVFSNEADAELIASRSIELGVWDQAEFNYKLSKNGVVGYEEQS
tara:strand:- start:233 stop:430 length:198 start_codon:yes stop_codon:yes gene_type:complete